MARKRTIQSRSSARKGKKKKNNLIFLVVTILVIFFSGLYFLKSKSNVAANDIVPIETKKVKPKAELPTPPEERWTYIKALENRTVVDNQTKRITNNKNLTAEQKRILAQMSQDQRVVKSKSSVKAQVQPSSTSVSHVNQQNKNYGLQCGAFKKNEQAESQKAKLAMLGFNARVTNNGGWYRVFVGPLGNREKAKTMLTRIGSHVTCLIIAM